ncbi:uncharacterized protein LOC124663375 [Lolium rigidum]|uniref:uncharacterized protein LOC124663375 n=2 Tax=Lolium rigidum TaxID=89674 RepID=UPI001F5CF627|nr:uncharacterized protein LOC124663375 [Lolium rigidum]
MDDNSVHLWVRGRKFLCVACLQQGVTPRPAYRKDAMGSHYAEEHFGLSFQCRNCCNKFETNGPVKKNKKPRSAAEQRKEKDYAAAGALRGGRGDRGARPERYAAAEGTGTTGALRGGGRPERYAAAARGNQGKRRGGDRGGQETAPQQIVTKPRFRHGRNRTTPCLACFAHCSSNIITETLSFHAEIDRTFHVMSNSYMKEGMRTSVEAILLVQEHNHPHILLLQIGNTFCKLPGGRLKPGENEIEGLKRKLSSKLAVNSPTFPPNWQVGECVAVWWRPNFETVMYPYCPPHIAKPKECKKLFIVHLTEKEYFAVPRNLKLLAVPLFELYDNVQWYGPVISTIPQQLSKFQFNMVSS